MSGWIKLHRNIKSHWIYNEKPFSKYHAWMDILLSANHKDNKFLLGNELVEVERGSFITSELKLMDKWGWSKTKVRNFLELLESDKMIVKVADRKKTTLTIVNYEVWQGEETTEKPQENHEETIKEPIKDTNKNEKNEKNDKEDLLCMYDENLKKIINLLETNIGVVPPILIDEIYEYSKTFKLDMFSEAIKIAANNKKRTVNYILGILRKWKDSNILNINDLEALRKEKEIEREDKQQSYQKGKKSYSKASKTRFHNFEQRSDKYSDDQLESVVARKRREYTERMKSKENI